MQRVSAATLVEALNNGVSLWGDNLADPAGRFPQASGGPGPARWA